MKITEITAETDRFGNLTIPALVLRESGIGPREKVYLAWIADTEEGWNTYREIFISPKGIAGVLEEDEPEFGEIQIPSELLEAAGIPDDDDVMITCADGAVIISRSDTDGLAALLGEYFILNGGVQNE